MPRIVAHELRYQDNRAYQFVLHTQAILRYARRRVVRVFAVRPLREQRRGSWSARLPIVVGVGEFHAACRRRVFERSSAGDVVDVVALLAFKEGAKAAAKYGLAISKEVIREADPRLVSIPPVFYDPARCPVLAGNLDAVQVELGSVEGLQTGTGRGAA